MYPSNDNFQILLGRKSATIFSVFYLRNSTEQRELRKGGREGDELETSIWGKHVVFYRNAQLRKI